MSKNTKPNPMAQMPPCFRKDGSFDFVAFLFAPPVLMGLILIILGLVACFLVSYVFSIPSKPVNAIILMICALTCFSGADNILRYLNTQRELKNKIK